jgi:hypothetical protein
MAGEAWVRQVLSEPKAADQDRLVASTIALKVIADLGVVRVVERLGDLARDAGLRERAVLGSLHILHALRFLEVQEERDGRLVLTLLYSGDALPPAASEP